MTETSLTLLNRLRQSPEPESWDQLVELYSPLIRAWLRRYDVQDSDVNDLLQEVLLAVAKDLIKFKHTGQPGAFRGWLKAILVNRLRWFWRVRGRRPQVRGDSDIDERLAQLDDPASELSRIWNQHTISSSFGSCWLLWSPISPQHLAGFSPGGLERQSSGRYRRGIRDLGECGVHC